VFEPLFPIRDAIEEMDRQASGFVVIADGGRFVDVITDGDFRRAMLANIHMDSPMAHLAAQKHKLHREPITAPHTATESEILDILITHEIKQLPLLGPEGWLDAIAIHAATEKGTELPVRAVVMAGGFGTRLRPLTAITPKPMLNVDGKPLLERIIGQLHSAGIRRVNVTTHHQADKIVEHFGSGDAFGVELEYVNEEEPLGTAGSLSLIDGADETVLVMNGDILTNMDFGAMLDFHRAHRAALTVAVRQYDVEVPYGVVECDGAKVRKLREKPNMSFFINAGIYLVEPGARELIPERKHFDMTDLIEALISSGKEVISFPIREYWLDIGQHEDYLRAQSDTRDGKVDSNRGG